ncbi:MAG: 50S ribosome-binding GTPase [Acidimicrobiia bacterium]|nr:50S ribosome-binding GTPase [Acidimicrobiia bacterium]MDH4306106.1 50S ribosome-binding GTPase [Acidimicrobiia bacterium]MDH5293658.1 50S ribosome-binding GTPase [Acidimicrobiia bacterium]
MPDLLDAIDAFDRVVAAAAESAPTAAVVAAGAVARRVRARRGYAGSTVVVALAGGTGSGKSSMINALAGEEVALSGALRPTTSEPLAWIPVNPEPGVIRLLDDIGIDDMIGQDRNDWLAVIDLPDTDSIELSHRQTVARLLPEVDAVVWVLDPEKYQDRVLHRDHLAPLADYQGQFVFVINQIDRVAESEIPAMVADLRASLSDDGIHDAVILTTAADPVAGPPQGIDDLVLALRSLGDAKAVVHRKLVTDLAGAAGAVAEAAGVVGGRGTGFSSEWDEILAGVAEGITDDVVDAALIRKATRLGRSAHGRAMSVIRPRLAPVVVELTGRLEGGRGSVEAIRRLDTYVTELARRLEGETAEAVRAVGIHVDDAVESAAETVSVGETIAIPAPAGWMRSLAWLRRVALLSLVGAVLWVVDAVRTGADLTIPVVVAVAALAGMAIPAFVGRTIGGREAARVARHQRGAIARAVAREIDRRVGRPLRDALRRRAGVAAALAEFELVMNQMR